SGAAGCRNNDLRSDSNDMKAIRAHNWCQPRDLVMDDIDRPRPREGEALIKIESAALNFPDLLLIAGKDQVKPPLPFSPGVEVAGTIEDAGADPGGLEPGQRVMAQLNMGGFAEYAVAPLSAIRRLPSGMTYDEAAAFPLVYQTSYFGLAYRAALKRG